jgi:small nuclear ribonucleoprotein (snRNP)-like protein
MELNWGMEYKGYLVSVDAYMNLQVNTCVMWCCASKHHHATRSSHSMNVIGPAPHWSG